ncbi:MAG: CCA tRNA nucleotidyltransferase [Lachnospiraceae bacterium]|nr:CCA tRNA nucleotidyltransferase [Lachnospiraceae bacterium]
MQQFPANVRTIIKKLQDAGYEAYAVGGCVRDSVLGRVPNDWDITTNALPEQVKKLFRRTIDVGIEHGTVKVMIGNDGYEITTYRIDGAYEDNRHPKEVTFTPDLREDLRRRDFTINAMASSEKTGLVDLFGGLDDLKNRVIRAVGDPYERFDEDALRILRALRFSAVFDFDIEEGTKKAIKDLAGNLANISAERIRQELEKLICSDHPGRLRDAYDLGVTKVIFPEWDMMTECEQETPHHFTNVGDHTIAALEYIVKNFPDLDEKDDRILRIATVLHDIAKPAKKFRGEDGADHFTGHPAEGVAMAENFLRRLKYDNDTIKRVKKLVRYHDDTPKLTYPRVRRFIVDVEVSNMDNLMRLKYADLYAHTDYMFEEKLGKIETLDKMYGEIMKNNDCLSIGSLAVGGSDLIAMGIPAGPAIGKALSELLEAVLDDPLLNDREKLLDRVRRITE